MLMIGKSISRYHILEQLGQGGMATVYKAYDTRLERDVALKIIRRGAFPPEVLDRVLTRFEREAKVLAHLNHPNIVSVLDYGEFEGSPYLVMPFIEGGTLKSYINGPIPWQEAVRIVLAIAQALEHAHQKKIIHRDVKPSNILITKAGHPMLSDFGIAKLLEFEEGHTLTGTGVGVGTPEYMAPEQGLGKDVDGRADVYALGVVMYELVTGRKPYTADTPLAVLLKQVNDPLPRAKGFIPDLPEEVERVLVKALAKQPEDRYPDMSAFAQALEKLGQTVVPKKEKLHTASRIPIASPLLQEETKTIDTLIAASNNKQTKRHGSFIRRRLLRGGLSVLGLVTLVGIGFWVNNLFKTPSNMGLTGEEGLSAETEQILIQVKTETPIIAAVLAETDTLTVTSTPNSTTTPRITLTPTLGVGSTMISPKDGMEMAYVPAGTFVMGSNTGELNEQPIHEVYLDGYWIDRYEVTIAQYTLCVVDGFCNKPRGNLNSFDQQQPIINVNWNSAKEYCAWVGRRLPTEAEWEKAARGTDRREFPWGNQVPNQQLLNFNNNVGYTTTVGGYSDGASPYGVYDMAGNVSEWVADRYIGDYYTNSVWKNPTGPTIGQYRVYRGGSYKNNGYISRSTYRYRDNPQNYYVDRGFRCASSEPAS